MYIAASQGQTTPGDEILMSTGTSCHFGHFLQVSKKSLWSLILYIYFHDLIHVYSPGAGDIQPQGEKVLMSTEMSCHFIHLLQVLKKCLWSLILCIFFHDLIHVYSPRAGADNPQGTKFWCQGHFIHLLQVSKKCLWSPILYNFFHDLIYSFVLCWGFTVQSTTRSCRAGQLIAVLFPGRLRSSKRLTSTKWGCPRQ